jgi:hypothetical protein
MTQTEIFRPKYEDVAEDVAVGVAVGVAVAVAACSKDEETCSKDEETCSEDEETCSVGEVATLGVVGGLLGYFGSKALKKPIRLPVVF